ncbi:MAG: PIN domain-containing protein [Vicinamibacterales bacterium]
MGALVVRKGPRAGPKETVNRPVLLDSSFLIAFERETAAGVQGPAHTLLHALRGRRLVVSVVGVAEILEGAAHPDAALAALQRFSIQGVHIAQAQRCALMQRRSKRRLGENDAWLVATAESIDADVVGADRAAFERLGDRYLRFR